MILAVRSVAGWNLPQAVSNTFSHGSHLFKLSRRIGTKSFASTLDTTEQDTFPSVTDIPRVLLKRNRQSKAFRDGSQLVFSKAVDKAPSSLKIADLVQVEVPATDDPENRNTQLVGWGVFNPDSMYRIRILQHATTNRNVKKEAMGNTNDFMKEILKSQMKKALKIRQTLGLPSATTDTYRMINGEGDGLSGMAVDIIGNKVAVVMSSAAWCQIHRFTILECLQEVLPNHELIWKTTPSRLRQDGLDAGSDEEDDAGDEEEASSPVIGMENGIKFQTFPHLKGQKTGVYCDQRENRFNFAQLCKGKVLDLCCYHGGFSLNAALQGAASVVGVDSSLEAVEICQLNAAMNGLEQKTTFVKSDIADYMRSCTSSFDAVVLDPPKLAPSVSGLAKASRKYHSLNRDALKLVSDDGGIFMTCTCSAAMTQKDGGRFFLQTVQQASLSAQREITLVRVSAAAPCHTQSPVSFPAGSYLTAALFYVHPKTK